MDTARLVLGFAVAALLPHCLPVMRRNHAFCLMFTAMYAGWTFGHVANTWKFPVFLMMALGWSIFFWIMLGRRDIGNRRILPIIAGRASGGLALVVIAAAASLLVVALVDDRDGTVEFLKRSRDLDRPAIVVSCLLLAVFISHFPVTYAAFHFGADQAQGISYFNVHDVSLFIGWFERALIFVFIVGGQAEAAALALAAKSLARYPEFERNPSFGKFFLVGTFGSVLAAIFWAVVARLSLGLAPM